MKINTYYKGLKSDLRYHLREYYQHRYIFMRGIAGSVNPFAIHHKKCLVKELNNVVDDVTFIEQIKHHTVVFNIKPIKKGKSVLTISKVLETI